MHDTPGADGKRPHLRHLCGYCLLPQFDQGRRNPLLLFGRMPEEISADRQCSSIDVQPARTISLSQASDRAIHPEAPVTPSRGCAGALNSRGLSSRWQERDGEGRNWGQAEGETSLQPGKSTLLPDSPAHFIQILKHLTSPAVHEIAI